MKSLLAADRDWDYALETTRRLFSNSLRRWMLPAIAVGLLLTGQVQAHPPELHRPLAIAGAQAAQAQQTAAAKLPDFQYDAADEIVDSQMVGEPLWYDADILPVDDTLWLAWLEFTPGEGDRLWLGARRQDQWLWKRPVIEQPGDLARPTLTAGADGRIWLSYEQSRAGQWDIVLQPLSEGMPEGDPRLVSDSSGPDIRHRASADASGGLWFVWQSDVDGQFEILARKVSSEQMAEPLRVSNSPRGDWHPALACLPGGRVCVAWDAHDGDSYNVLTTFINKDGSLTGPKRIAATAALESRVDVAADAAGRCWLIWEEGGENWGRPYRPRLQTTNLTDQLGPLHRFRRLRLACIETDGSIHHPATPLPMLSLDLAAARTGVTKGVKHTGAFYERARLAIDKHQRPWVAYRHFYTPWLGAVHRSHVEAGWGVYARCLSEQGWSPLFKFGIGQGDGLQRLEIVPQAAGIAAAWTTGRTHRTKNNRPRGVAVATIAGDDLPAEKPPAGRSRRLPRTPDAHRPTEPREVVEFDGKRYHLVLGDLHRHTDLSLCRVPIDGTIDDAYRYAIDAAELDFLGITDHSRDIAMGDPLSQLWWRSRKEVQRHALGRSFFPFYAYERSHSNTADHNVISLRDDMLRAHTYPVPVFWKEIDPATTIMIPHQPYRRDTWKYQDDERRPLAEIYQGARDRIVADDVHQGLDKGYRLGIIASSDHMSTSASYACAWAESPSRESIFAAFKARRTYGATAPLRLTFRVGEHWMGEAITAESLPPLSITATGTDTIRAVELIVDGRVHKTWTPQEREIDIKERIDLAGKRYLYVHLIQVDGNHGWSSPVWIDIPEEKAAGK